MLTHKGKEVRVQFYGTRELRAVLGIGKTKANDIMHEFKARGQAYMIGNRYKVKVTDFEKWMQYSARRVAQ